MGASREVRTCSDTRQSVAWFEGLEAVAVDGLCELIGFGWTQQAKKVCVILNVTSTEQLPDDLNSWTECGGKVDYCRVR